MGFERSTALLIAADHEIDLHTLEDLLTAGATHDQAIRIVS